MDFRKEGNEDLVRLELSEEASGTWQNNLATAAMMIKKGYSKGVSVDFGGFNWIYT